MRTRIRWLRVTIVTLLFLTSFPLPKSVSQELRQPDPRWNMSVDLARGLINQAHPGRDLTPESWPGGKRVAVALTFDLDAELVWLRYPETASPSKVSRGHYGARAALARILALLEKRQIPATFFFPAMILKLHPDAVASIRRSKLHEIGYHGYAHEAVGTLTEAQERDAMTRGLQLFREAGIQPKVYRSPSWDFSPATLRLLKEFGFRFDSSLMADDRPYEILEHGTPSGVIELPVDWSKDDWPYFQLEWEAPLPGLRSPGEVFEIWREEFEGIRSEGGLFILTMHPQVIGHWNRLRMLERLLDHLDASGDAWYATLGSIGEHLQKP
ncbi:MAG: polysaccharide deacetylase [Ignavibacteria bacterium]|nr:polysaccharide deacetylase [Ignavibacteria bacterium]